MIKKFIIRIIVFCGIPLGIFSLFLFEFHDKLPSPKLTKSYSLNEKLFFFDDYDCDVLAFGSSMTLVNIKSEVIAKKFYNKKFLNLGSWGIRLVDDYIFLLEYLKNHNPELIIISSNLMDFYDSGIQLNKNQIKGRLGKPKENIFPIEYIKNFDLKYYIKYYFDNKINKHSDSVYTSINFDKHGGISYTAEKLFQDSARWTTTFDFNSIELQNYVYLDSICNYLQNNKIELIFIQTPNPPGFVTTDHKKNMLIHHEKVEHIINNYGFKYINGSHIEWPDSLFIDFNHFSKEGSTLFTKFVISKM